jgi:LPS O-antigen subunit length determinant protein (WzzB/FepE family)
MLTEWASWRWVMYMNAAFAATALIGALLLVKPVITKKPKRDTPGIFVVSVGSTRRT